MPTNDLVITIEQEGANSAEASRERIMEMLEEGASVQSIAARLGLEPDKVLAVAEHLQTESRADEDNSERLRKWARQLDEGIEIALWQYKSSPQPGYAQAWTALVQTAQSVVSDLDSRQDPEKVRLRILMELVIPLMENTLESMTLNLEASSKELLEILPPERQEAGQLIIKNVLKSLGATFDAQKPFARDAVNKIISDKAQQSKNQGPGRPRKQIGKGSPP